jgi:hypothetical protein
MGTQIGLNAATTGLYVRNIVAEYRDTILEAWRNEETKRGHREG